MTDTVGISFQLTVIIVLLVLIFLELRDIRKSLEDYDDL